MAHVRKGHITAAPEWWKHLREMKRVFWKRERKAHKHAIAQEELQDIAPDGSREVEKHSQ